MKRNFLAVLLTLAAVLCLCFGLVACGGNNGSKGEGGSSVEQGGEQQPDEGGEDKTDLGTEGLKYEQRKDEAGNEYIAVVGLGTTLETEIVIPSVYLDLPVKEIGKSAFDASNDARNESLTSVTIPDSVTSIEGRAFYGCSGLTSIEVAQGNPVYHSSGNCLIETKNKILSIGCKTSKIPDDGSVTSIGSFAFSGCSGLKSVEIPDSVTSIGDSAFYGCSGLESVMIGNGVISIVSGAFFNCSRLTSIAIPDSVRSIGTNAFWGCSGLESIGIPGSVTSIQRSTFYQCSGLKSVTIGSGVASIGECAFLGCSTLTSIVIPDSVTSVKGDAFASCIGVESIEVAQGNPVYHSSQNCLIETESKALIVGCKTSTIPSDGSVTSIGECAFSWCSPLTSIEIPDSVTSIGDKAFYCCYGLTSITIPDSVTSIGDGAFDQCIWLAEIQFKGTVKEWQAIPKGDWWDSGTRNYTITCTDGTIDKSGNVTYFEQ